MQGTAPLTRTTRGHTTVDRPADGYLIVIVPLFYSPSVILVVLSCYSASPDRNDSTTQPPNGFTVRRDVRRLECASGGKVGAGY